MKTDSLKSLSGDLGLETDLWWLAMMMVGLMATFLAAFAYPGASLFWAWLAVVLRLSMAACLTQQPWGGVFRALLPFGLAVGAFSIFGDFLLVNWHERGQRIYPAGGGVLLSSPLYIPLFWACMVVEFGYAIFRIWSLLEKSLPGEGGLYLSMLLGAVLVALWTACTDFWAVKAGWWFYEPGVREVKDSCALYVVIGHFLIFVPFLPLFESYLACAGTRLYAALRHGMIYGVVIFLGYVAGHALVERRL
jgi:hypothetical protein